jgi:hypothetical protein
MNSDVLKSLGYSKKMLKMLKRAIANANDIEYVAIGMLVNNLINEIEKVAPVDPAVVGGAALGNTLAPNSVPVAPVAPVAPVVPVVPVTSDNGIDFLVP